MKLQVNIFTNSMLSAPRTDIIEKTYQSFIDTFGDKYNFAVYCDSHPNFKMFKFYFEALQKMFPVVYKTTSLSDGYVKSVNNTDADYLFQLEGDWIFNKHLIKHSLEEIAAVMSAHGLYHLRFNKRANVVSGWDIGLKEKKCFYSRELELTYCETSVLSNNPHIIDVKKYRQKCLPLIEIKSGSKGIEEKLTYVGLTGAIYGPLNYPQTVVHQDGRKSR